jgi:hypothetical protein
MEDRAAKDILLFVQSITFCNQHAFDKKKPSCSVNAVPSCLNILTISQHDYHRHPGVHVTGTGVALGC